MMGSNRQAPAFRQASLKAMEPAILKAISKKSVEQDTKYARQSGGKGQYGHVRITVERPWVEERRSVA